MPSELLPTPSIVLEWENVRLSGRSRVLRVLSEVHAQLQALRPELEAEPELLITYQLRDIASADLLAILRVASGDTNWPCSIRLIAVVPGESYYEQKNRGAFSAINPVVLFLDSDVLPQHGWLRAMLEPFRQWETSVLAGWTSVDAGTFYGRATALYWILPPPPALPSATGAVQPLQGYFANNLAFRRSLFLRVPFPASEAYRGQCAAQLAELRARGIPVVQQAGALTLHPPPPGISGFLERAWRSGAGACLHLQGPQQGSLRLPLTTFLRDLDTLQTRIRLRAPTLQSGPWSEPRVGSSASSTSVSRPRDMCGQRFSALALALRLSASQRHRSQDRCSAAARWKRPAAICALKARWLPSRPSPFK